MSSAHKPGFSPPSNRHHLRVRRRIPGLNAFVVACGDDLPRRVDKDGPDGNAAFVPGLLRLGEHRRQILLHGPRHSLPNAGTGGPSGPVGAGQSLFDELADVVLELRARARAAIRELDSGALAKRVLADAAGIAPRG